MLNSAWRRFSPISWAGLGLLAATTVYWWQQPKARLSHEELMIARLKTGFVVGAVACTAAATYFGNLMAEQTPDERTPVESGNEPSPRTPPRARRAQAATQWLGAANIACGVGVIVCSALLSHRKRTNTSWLW